MRDNYPELGAQIPHEIVKISPGDPGIVETLQYMRRLALDASRDPRMRALGIRVVAAISPRDDRGRAGAILRWCQRNIRYVRDIRRIETLQWPQRTLAWRAGDCDDFSTLMAALLLALGFNEIGFVAQRRVAAGPYKHVFAVCRVNGTWLKMDGTSKEPISKMRWDKRRHYLQKI